MNPDQLKGLDTWWRGESKHGLVTLALRSIPRPKKGRLRIQSYTSRLPHLCLNRQGMAPIGSCCLSRLGSFASYATSGVPAGLTASELTQTRLHWIKMVQAECFSAELDALQKNADLPRESKITRFNPFLEDGLIRLGGRLQCADLSTDLRHPILLDGKHHFVHLLI